MTPQGGNGNEQNNIPAGGYVPPVNGNAYGTAGQGYTPQGAYNAYGQGQNLPRPQASNYQGGYNPYGPNGGFAPPLQKEQKDDTNVLGIVSLVLGILSIVLFCCGWTSIVLGIAAVITGIFGLRQPKGKGVAIAGIVCGSVGMLIFCGMYLLFVWAKHQVGVAVSSWGISQWVDFFESL